MTKFTVNNITHTLEISVADVKRIYSNAKIVWTTHE